MQTSKKPSEHIGKQTFVPVILARPKPPQIGEDFDPFTIPGHGHPCVMEKFRTMPGVHVDRRKRATHPADQDLPWRPR